VTLHEPQCAVPTSSTASPFLCAALTAACLQASLSAKSAELDAAHARVSELELQLAQALEQGSSYSHRLATLQVSE